MKQVRIQAPAKVNLGLSVLGKRPDGFHNIDSILAMIDLFDDITIHEGVVAGISITGMDDVPIESNLITQAIQQWCDEAMVPPNWHVEISKRVPSPSGLGGGSSDAAAILKGLNALHHNALSTEHLHALATDLGADCPFFLGSATARATGIGTNLEELPPAAGSLVLAIPPTNTQAKTASLYGRLTPDDYGTSDSIDEIESDIRSGAIDQKKLTNSFTSAAMAEFEGLKDLTDLFGDVTGKYTLSGAGPAVFALAESEDEAWIWADHLRAEITEDILIVTTNFLDHTPVPEVME